MPTNHINKKQSNRVAPPRLNFQLQIASASTDLPSSAAFQRWARAALIESVDVTVRLVNSSEGRALNRAYRHRDNATNVLTFVYQETRPLSGDIVLCLPVVREEARRQGKTTEAHLAHLTVHGMLHLQGFDHESDVDAELMEGLETEIVCRLGYPAPYEKPARSRAFTTTSVAVANRRDQGKSA